MKGGSTDNLSIGTDDLLGKEADRLPSNSADEAVPVLWGTRFLGGKHLTDVLNYREEPVFQDTSKKDVQSGVNRFGTWATKHCVGPVDACHELRDPNGKVIWEGPIFRGSESFVDISVEKFGTARLYWGTETQNPDPNLPDHPGYRGQCYIVWIDFAWGYNASAAPAIEAKLSRWPKPSFLSSLPNVQGDCNAIAIVADALTNPRVNFGWEDARLKTGSLSGVASEMAAVCVGISPVLTDVQSLSAFFAMVNDHVGGYVVPSTDGLFDYKLLREPPTWAGVPVIDERHLLSEPELDDADDEDIATVVNVVFTHNARGGKADHFPYVDPAARRLAGERRSVTIERRGITRYEMAVAYANAYGPVRCSAARPGRVRVRASAASAIEPGGVFRLSYGHLGLCGLPCRAIEVNIPSPTKPEVEIVFEVDRSHLTVQQTTPPDYVPPVVPSYEPERIEDVRFLELPAGVPQLNEVQRVAVLAARPNAYTSALNVHSRKPGGSFYSAGSGSGFARHGALVASYPADTQPMDSLVRFVVQLDGTDNTLPSIELEDAMLNEWVAFIGDEVLAIYDVTLQAVGRYRVSAIRGRFDTTAQTHAAGAEVFIVKLATIIAPGFYDERSSQWLKLQPVTPDGALDLAEVTATNVPVSGRNMRPLQPLNLRGLADNDPHQQGRFTTGQSVQLYWTNVVGYDYKAAFWLNQLDPLLSVDLEIVALDGTVKQTLKLSREATAAESHTLSDSDIATALGGSPDSFRVRAYHVKNGLRSRLYSETLLTYVP